MFKNLLRNKCSVNLNYTFLLLNLVNFILHCHQLLSQSYQFHTRYQMLHEILVLQLNERHYLCILHQQVLSTSRHEYLKKYGKVLKMWLKIRNLVLCFQNVCLFRSEINFYQNFQDPILSKEW